MSVDQIVSEFDQMQNQYSAASELDRIIQAKKIPNALLFTGNPGTGKINAALNLVKACNCLESNNIPCDTCRFCKKITAGMHPDIIKILPEKKVITISQIREMGLLLSSRPNEAKKRMVLISHADKMNVQAQNALLKMLEEPSENTFFVLIARGPSCLLPTVLSRCRHLRFNPLKTREIERTLIESHKIDQEKAYIISQIANNDLSKALMFLNLSDQESQLDWPKRRKWLLNELLTLLTAKGPQRVHIGLCLSLKLSLDQGALIDSISIVRSFLRDLIIYKYHPKKIVNLDFFDSFEDINQRYTYGIFLGWLKHLLDTEKRLESNISIRLALDHFFLKLSSTKGI
jgi:DNA polymerase III subunit delta'